MVTYMGRYRRDEFGFVEGRARGRFERARNRRARRHSMMATVLPCSNRAEGNGRCKCTSSGQPYHTKFYSSARL